MQESEESINCFPRFLIILIIPLLLYCTLLISYFGIISLKAEFHSVIIVGFIFLIFLFFIKHNAWFSYCKFINSLDSIIAEVDEYINHNELEIANKKKSIGCIEPFFEKHIRNIRNDNFASIASSIFPTLGILGTFVAIAISMPDFTAESQEALDREITILLSGVGTAFYASIYGIFLSIWWIFFEKRGLSKIEKKLDSIRELYKDKIWTKEEIEILSIIQNKLQNENLLNKLENTINPEFVQSLDRIAQSKIQLIQKLNDEHKNLEVTLFKRYKNIIHLFDKSAAKQDQLMVDFEKIHNLLSSINSQSSNSMLDLSNFTKALKSEIYAVLSSFELVAGDLKSLGHDLIRREIEESQKDEQKK